MWRQKTLIKSELAQLDKFIKIYTVQALRNWEMEPDPRSPITDTRYPSPDHQCFSLTPTLDGATKVGVILIVVDHLLEGFLLWPLRRPWVILLESIDAVLGYGRHSGSQLRQVAVSLCEWKGMELVSIYIYSIFSMIIPVTFSCFSTRARETDRHFPFQKLDSTEPSSCHNPNQKQRNSSCVQVEGRRWSLSSRWITIIVLYI